MMKLGMYCRHEYNIRATVKDTQQGNLLKFYEINFCQVFTRYNCTFNFQNISDKIKLGSTATLSKCSQCQHQEK